MASLLDHRDGHVTTSCPGASVRTVRTASNGAAGSSFRDTTTEAWLGPSEREKTDRAGWSTDTDRTRNALPWASRSTTAFASRAGVGSTF